MVKPWQNCKNTRYLIFVCLTNITHMGFLFVSLFLPFYGRISRVLESMWLILCKQVIWDYICEVFCRAITHAIDYSDQNCNKFIHSYSSWCTEGWAWYLFIQRTEDTGKKVLKTGLTTGCGLKTKKSWDVASPESSDRLWQLSSAKQTHHSLSREHRFRTNASFSNKIGFFNDDPPIRKMHISTDH